ncbi:MAG: toll/interleukin-1 receptor domain-containing protein [Candidatus Aminicenantes bacterium]|nr:toll/interleukin-1 receptor domain-containing protein [Acidobacteriota bacterium]MCG2812331.1 toll/interleukin-1 receptor domain-containing protein [Candidatus Aminicenantes bacterium]
MKFKKKKITFFVSYARANKELANRFLTKFQEQLTPSKKFEYVLWKDVEILVGEKWHEEIQDAIKICRLGLFLVSPAFLGSQYIQKHELPKFIKGGSKAIIPIMLQPVDFDRHDLKGLEKVQIFRLEGKQFQSPKAYGDCVGNQRNRFVHELFKQVENRMDKLF